MCIRDSTHAVSKPAQQTALEVLAANNVETIIQQDDGITPTPVISRAILVYNRGRKEKDHLADGIVITPSHNPPEDGGFKYDPPNGGPADTDVTRWVENRANELLRAGNAGVKRIPFAKAIRSATTHQEDFVLPYVRDLKNVVDMDAIRGAHLRLGVDPLGGASLPYWQPINSIYGLDIVVTNPIVDPTFSFMTVDHDGKIRMDCSSPYAMARLVGLKDQYQVAFGNDTDADRHGIVTPVAGLMNPNHYLAVAIRYLLNHRPQWRNTVAVGKTVVSSSVIDRVVKKLGRELREVPVGFKWFVPGLFDGSYCFGGEESAGASFLRLDGTVWTTDKDGLIMDLLAAEITARTGKNPGEHYRELTAEFGIPYYTRVDAPATPEQKAKLEKLTPDAVKESDLAGEAITAKLTKAPGNDAPIGGDVYKRQLLYRVRREFRQLCFLLGRGGRVDAGVVRGSELRRQFAVVFSGILASARGNLRRQQVHDRPVLVGRPHSAVKTKKTRSSAFLSAETIRSIDQARHKPLETPVSYTHLDVYKRQPGHWPD